MKFNNWRNSELRLRAVEVIKEHGPSTADEIALRLNESVLSIRPRITELAYAGILFNTGFRRRNVSGRRAIVWGVDTVTAARAA